MLRVNMKWTFAPQLFLLAAACRTTSHGARTEAVLAADRAFASDTHARPLEGWLAAFDEHGSQVDHIRTVTSREAIAGHMRAFLADPANELT